MYVCVLILGRLPTSYFDGGELLFNIDEMLSGGKCTETVRET